jgi:phosphoenolpyruvate-protein phosphotransferase
LTQEHVLTGIPAAPGLAEGALVPFQSQALSLPEYAPTDPDAEWARLESALQAVDAALTALQADLEGRGQPQEAAVFGAHRLFLTDRALLGLARKNLSAGQNIAFAWNSAVDFFAAQLEALPDPTLRARAADIRDVGQQVLARLLGVEIESVRLDGPSVIVAADLTPSQTARLDLRYVRAFCTTLGGPTSHTAILAKALGLPAVVALGDALLSLPAGSLLLVDGGTGRVVANPAIATASAFTSAAEQDTHRRAAAAAAAAAPAVTLDGKVVEVAANIGSAEDARIAVENGADGVGLFRTELLYLDRRDLPSEAEQVATYRQVFRLLAGRPVVVRTLDIGGDKPVPYLDVAREDNPFLGWRGIRILNGRADLLLGQLRALLQAGVNTDLRIMFPMVSGLPEVLAARSLLDQAASDLTAAGLPVATRLQVGIMVEVPSAALLADRLTPHVDFFSIGTNDLTQYTLAVDRTNSRVAALASPYHPAVLDLIARTIRAGQSAGKWVGLCGELAGDPLAAPLLLGLGLDEFSMAAPLIPHLKQALRAWSVPAAQAVAEQALALDTAAEVIDYLKGVQPR